MSRESDAITAPGAIFHNELRNKNRISEIGKIVVESLQRVKVTKRIKISFRVWANQHEGNFLSSTG